MKIGGNAEFFTSPGGNRVTITARAAAAPGWVLQLIAAQEDARVENRRLQGNSLDHTTYDYANGWFGARLYGSHMNPMRRAAFELDTTRLLESVKRRKAELRAEASEADEAAYWAARDTRTAQSFTWEYFVR